jgi:6-pyruvoyltetrahydropterin/6-carboxytetrahydropterin synthase
MIEIIQEFTFDAAHHLGVGAPQNDRIHGHSFYVEVTLRGEPSVSTGVLRDFADVKATLAIVSEDLDHRLLNDVEGLGLPTLENLARYIFVRLKIPLPELARVRIRRPSYGQACVYEES